MTVESIALSGFRNYGEEKFDFEPGVNVICGSNAQGKTNLLEAVYLLSGAHSFRTRYDRELIGFDRDWADICGRINSAGRTHAVRILFRKGQRRKVTVDTAAKRSAELGQWMKVVLFSPEDLFLIREGAAARRRLMDDAICQLKPVYASLLADYNKLYENKTSILKQWRERADLLAVLDEFSRSLARCSAKMIRYRASFVDRLAQAAVPAHRDFSSGGEELGLTYKTISTVTDPKASEESLYDQIWQHQQLHRQAELDAGMCLTGIHKDDILITINGREARNYSSQGQARTAALCIKLAEREIFRAETGEYPVLLLDDVLSELDAARQEFVLNRIGGGQTLITCCEQGDISQRTGGSVLMIQDGHLL